MRVSMAAIIEQAGRKFNLDEADGVSRRHRSLRGTAPVLDPTTFWVDSSSVVNATLPNSVLEGSSP